jgi:hypothetical protein
MKKFSCFLIVSLGFWACDDDVANVQPEGEGEDACAEQVCPTIGCPEGTVSTPREGECCPVCVPTTAQCEGTRDDCNDFGGCVETYETFEFTLGCCVCKMRTCEDISCPEPGCPAGSTAEFVDDSCCAVCVSEQASCIEDNAPCDDIVCPLGYTPRTDSNNPQCCDACTIDPLFCADEATAYGVFLEGLLAGEGALACTDDSDCAEVGFSTRCKGDCGTGVSAAQAESLLEQARAYAEENCAHCPDGPVACPAVEVVPVCLEGVCGLRP